MRFLVSIVSLVLLAGCGPGARIELAVDSDDPEIIRRTQAVLYKRLVKASGNPFVNVGTGYFPDTGKLVFEYDRSAPDPESIRFLYETRGEYRLASASADGEETEWINNRDIAGVESSRSGGQGQVFFALSIDAASRLQELSKSNIGTTVRATLDGDTLVESEVLAPFGPFYQFELPSEAEARNLVIILTSGVLPVNVTSYDTP